MDDIRWDKGDTAYGQPAPGAEGGPKRAADSLGRKDIAVGRRLIPVRYQREGNGI